MESKITKVILGGKEYVITDKQAQQMLDVMNTKIDALENEILELRNELNTCITWAEYD